MKKVDYQETINNNSKLNSKKEMVLATKDCKRPSLDIYKEISFPEYEYESVQSYLDRLGYCYTTRVYKEVGKYKVGELYVAPWGDVLKIDEVTKYWKVSDRPFYDEMSDDEKQEISEYSEDMGLPYEFIKFSRDLR